MKKLHLGCGSTWRNYKGYIGLDIVDSGQKYVGDVLELLRFGGAFSDTPVFIQEWDEVMANHFLEHFDQNELQVIFQNVHRILKPSGLFKIVVPSKNSMRSYILTHKTFWTEETFKALEYDKESHWRLFGRWKVNDLVQNSRNDIHCLLEKV